MRRLFVGEFGYEFLVYLLRCISFRALGTSGYSVSEFWEFEWSEALLYMVGAGFVGHQIHLALETGSQVKVKPMLILSQFSLRLCSVAMLREFSQYLSIDIANSKPI